MLRGDEFGRGDGRAECGDGGRAPVVRQQLREVAMLERGQPFKNILEVGPRGMAVEFVRLDHLCGYRRGLSRLAARAGALAANVTQHEELRRHAVELLAHRFADAVPRQGIRRAGVACRPINRWPNY